MNLTPLVSVICLCYNHSRFIEKAILSVLNQTYPHIEIVIVDDYSTDNSQMVIEGLKSKYPQIKVRLLRQNMGNCKAFNEGFKMSKGSYIIDLSADDELLPERIEEGLNCFSESKESCGINFTDAMYIDENSGYQKNHYKRNSKGELISKVPQGIIYHDLLSRYLICTPTMMIKREVFDYLQGYDEDLAYEDFDFWIRTAKVFRYCYSDKVLIKKRLLPHSASTKQYEKGSKHLYSTLKVCLKAEKINENEEDRKALMQRLGYETRKSIFSQNYATGLGFIEIAIRNSTTWFGKKKYEALKLILKSISGYPHQ